MGLGRGVKFLIYFLEGGGSGQPGNPSGYTLAFKGTDLGRPGVESRLIFSLVRVRSVLRLV